MSKLDSEDLTYEDLVEYALDLEKQIEERDNEIADLTKGQTGKGRRRGPGGASGTSDDYAILETELNDLRDKISSDQSTITKLREEVANANIKITSLTEEKTDYDKKVKGQSKRIEDLEREIREISKKSEMVELKSREFNKQKSQNFQANQQLTQEIEDLRDDNKELESKVIQLEKDKETLEEIVTRFAEERDELEANHNNLDIHKEQLESRIVELEADLEEAVDKLQTSLQQESDWEKRYQQLQQEMHQLQIKSNQDLIQAKRDQETLQKQIVTLQESTKLGQVQKAHDELANKQEKNDKLLDDLQKVLEETIQERDVLSEKVIELEDHIEDHVAQRIAQERQQIKRLEAQIESMYGLNKSNTEYYHDLEEEKRQLEKEKEELINWKMTYEAGHGLQQLSRNIKKLTDDNRRLSLALEQSTTQIGQLIDSNNIISLSFDKLKKEAGKPASFQYPEYELQQEVKSMLLTQQLQLQQLELQLNDLELENSKLRKSLREQLPNLFNKSSILSASRDGKSSSLKTIKLEDLKPEQIEELQLLLHYLQQNELDYRTSSLIRSTGQQGLVHSSTEGALIKTQDSRSNSLIGSPRGILSDTFGADIQTLLKENQVMHDHIKSLNQQLQVLIDTKANSPRVNTDLTLMGNNEMISYQDLSELLQQNNDMILKELEMIRRSQQEIVDQGISGGGSTSLPPVVNRYRQIVRVDAGIASSGGGFSAPPTGKKSIPGTPATSVKFAQSSKLSLDVAMTPIRQDRSSIGGTPYWTPNMQRGGVFFPSTPNLNQSSYMSTPAVPHTPQGKQLLNNTIYNLNLPPEEWTSEVKDLTAQLVECLEQLYEREYDLEEATRVIKDYEESMMTMKLQVMIIYSTYAKEYEQVQAKEKQLQEENIKLIHENEDLQVKYQRILSSIQHVEEADRLKQPEESIAYLSAKVMDLTKTLMRTEINEQKLIRKYTILQEEVLSMKGFKEQMIQDFIDMETILKQRILLLEQYKITSMSRVSYLQSQIDTSISMSDYENLSIELNQLRSDYLCLLSQHVHVETQSISAYNYLQELTRLRHMYHIEHTDNEQQKLQIQTLQTELKSQQEKFSKMFQSIQADFNAMVSGQNNGNKTSLQQDFLVILQEIYQYRQEINRLEIELITTRQQNQELIQLYTNQTKDIQPILEHIQEYEQENKSLQTKLSTLQSDLVNYQINYAQGITKVDKEQWEMERYQLKKQEEQMLLQIQEKQEKYEIMYEQLQSYNFYQTLHKSELDHYQTYCLQLESKSDDDCLIGRLQRQLLSTKSSYKLFYHKYQFLRENARKKEIKIRLLENTIEQMKQDYYELSEHKQQEITALRQSLHQVKETIVSNALQTQQHFLSPMHHKSSASASYAQPVRSSFSQDDKQADDRADSKDDSNAATRNYQKTNRLLQKMSSYLLSNPILSNGNNNNDQGPSIVQQSLEHHPLQANKPIYFFATDIGKQVMALSQGVFEYTQKAEESMQQHQEQTKEFQQLREEIEDLQHIKDNYEQRLLDLQSILTSSSGNPSSTTQKQTQQQLSNRLIQLSEENRRYKLQNLQQRRNILSFREENKSLKTIIHDMELHLKELEKKKFDQEYMLDIYSTSQGESNNNKGSNSLFTPEELRELLIDSQTSASGGGSMKSTNKSKLSIDTDHLDNDEGDYPQDMMLPNNLDEDDEQRSRSRQQHRQQSRQQSQEISQKSLQIQSLAGQLSEHESLLQEKEQQLLYYERLLQEEGMHHVLLRAKQGRPMATSNPSNSPRYPVMRPEDQEKIQLAANETIRSLKAHVEDKNQLIERYRHKLEQCLLHAATKTHLDQRIDQVLLDTVIYEDDTLTRKRFVEAPPSPEKAKYTDPNYNNRYLAEQLDQAEDIVREKNETIRQLEDLLKVRQNQVDTAELRCGECLEELENMKADMITLVEQLKQREELLQEVHDKQHVVQAPPPPVEPQIGVPTMQHTSMVNRLQKKIKELEGQNQNKNVKITQYRDIIVKLKEEFIKHEEEKAMQAIHQSIADSGTTKGFSLEEMKELKDKINVLHDGLKTTKQDLEKAKRIREKLIVEKQTLQEQFDKMQEEFSKLSNYQSTTLQANTRLKKDLEESKRKEVKLREKIKEFLSAGGDGNAAAGGKAPPLGQKAMKEKLGLLEEENERLRKENEMLIKDMKSGGEIISKIRGDGSDVPLPSTAPSTTPSDPEKPKGHVLGGGDGGKDELRQQLHLKWEAEKKLQKRIETLEKRLQESLTNNEELQSTIMNYQNQMGSAANAANKKPATAPTTSTTANASRPVKSAQDIQDLEAARSQIFTLEEALRRAERKIQVDLESQIRNLNHQLSMSNGKVLQLESEIAEYEERRKKVAGSSSLQQSEDRFLREERLKDEIDYYRRRKLDLESSILEKDNAVLEQRFDLETAKLEVDRVKRRNQELEQAYKNLSKATPSSTGNTNDRNTVNPLAHIPMGSRREKELEELVENMKNIIERLKNENKRLERLAPPGSVAANNTPGAQQPETQHKGKGATPSLIDYEKRYQAEKKRAEKLTEEMSVLQAKLKGTEDMSQKITLRQQQILTLKKQLKTKEDEYDHSQKEISTLIRQRDELLEQISDLEHKIGSKETMFGSRPASRPSTATPTASTTPSNQQQQPSQQQTELIQDLRKRTSALQVEKDLLEQEVEELKNKLARTPSTTMPSSTSDRGPSSSSSNNIDPNDYRRLKDENTKLKQELAAFDLEFFEEIENLKFAHAEAIRKLRQYEQQMR